MKVYRVQADPAYQTLHSANRNPWYIGGDYLHFMCQRQGEKWQPPEYYVLEPLLPRGDFMGLQGYDPIVMRQNAYEKVGPILETCAELLPIEFEGEPMWVVNVLPCINALNRPVSVLPGDAVTLGRRRVDKFVFHDYRLCNYPLFKIPETMVNHVLLAHGRVDEAYDLKNLCEEYGLTGHSFKELWSSDSMQTGQGTSLV